MFSPADGPTWGRALERGDFPSRASSWPLPSCLLLHGQPCSAWHGTFRLNAFYILLFWSLYINLVAVPTATMPVNVSCSLPRSSSPRSSLMAL